jgi:hypothetical protein
MVIGFDTGPVVKNNVQIVVVNDAHMMDVPRSSLLVAPMLRDEREAAEVAVNPILSVTLLSSIRDTEPVFADRNGSILSVSGVLAAGSQVVTLPKTLLQARNAPDAADWEVSINNEVSAVIAKGTLMFLDRDQIPAGRTVTRTAFKFKLKYKGYELEKRKTRIVAHGQQQVYLEDYESVFAPTPQVSSMHVVMNLSMNFGLKMYHIDVTMAFLNPDLTDYNVFVKWART